MSNPSIDRPPLRIGTREREAAYTALAAHLDAGRLDPDEYGERFGRASVARTQPDLEKLFADLPAPHPVYGDPPPQPSWVTSAPRRRRLVRVLPAAFLLIPLLLIAVAAATGFWFLFFIIPFGASVLGRRFGHNRWRGYGRTDWVR